MTRAIFGERLLEIEPNLLEYFVRFDDNSWQLTYKLPHAFAKEMHSGKDKIIATFQQYFALPKKDRADATWIVHTLEREMRHLGLEEKDISSLFVMPFWVYVIFEPVTQVGPSRTDDALASTATPTNSASGLWHTLSSTISFMRV